MFKFFTTHLIKKNNTYLNHAQYALEVSLRLAVSSIAFFVHAIFPFIGIPARFNLESTSIYLFDKNIEVGD